MLTCESGRVITKKKQGKDWLYIRLNLIDKDTKKTKYKTRDIDTGLSASRKNRTVANAMVETEIKKYSPIGESTLLDDYCTDWLQKKKDEIELTTYESYEYRLKHIVDYFSNHPVTLGKLTPDDVNDFYHSLLTKKKTATSQHNERGLSNRTIKDIAVMLRTILSDAVMLGHVKDNNRMAQVINVKIPQKPESTVKDWYIGEDDINNFLSAIEGHRLEYPFLFGLLYGLRREEIVGLQWSAIRDGHIYIEHTVAKVKTIVSKDRTKTDASNRCYPVSDKVEAILEEIKATQEKNKSEFGDAYYDSDYVFTWENGRPYSPDYLTKSFKKLVRANEDLDDRLTLHSLRNSCVSILVHEGMDIKDIQSWVGHKDVGTTMNIYARTNEKQKNKVLDCMSNILFSS